MGLRSVRIPPYQVIAAGLLSWWPDDRRGRQGIETVQKQQPIDSSRNVLRKPNPRQPLPRSGGTSGIMKMMKSTNPNMAREPPTRSILLLGCCVVPVGRHFCSRTGLLRQDPWRPIAACQPKPADSAESIAASTNHGRLSSLSDSRRESGKAGDGLSSPRSSCILHGAVHRTVCVWTATKRPQTQCRCDDAGLQVAGLLFFLEAASGSGLAGWSSFPQRLGKDEGLTNLNSTSTSLHPSPRSMIHDP